jgi:hypothetical protein
MKKTFIYMNERIHEHPPTGPVVKVDRPDGSEDEGDLIEIKVLGRVVARVRYAPNRNPSKTHKLKAWVEVLDVPGVEVCV